MRAVILDLGNVLAFHDNRLLAERLASRGKRSADEVMAAFSGPLADAINRGVLDPEGIRREVCARAGAELPMSEFAAIWSSHFTPNEPLFPLVESLAGRFKLALLSNTNALHWESLRPRLPVLERFEALITSHQVHLVKPEPGIYRAALDALGVAPAEAVFFDDVPSYVEAAKTLGLSGFLFTDVATFRRDLASVGVDVA